MESNFNLTDCSAVEKMSYCDFKTFSNAILRGVLSKRKAQENDNFCSLILNSAHMHKGFVIIDGLLYSQKQNCLRLCLPIAL
jgi:hypothetical protein